MSGKYVNELSLFSAYPWEIQIDQKWRMNVIHCVHSSFGKTYNIQLSSSWKAWHGWSLYSQLSSLGTSLDNAAASLRVLSRPLVTWGCRVLPQKTAENNKYVIMWQPLNITFILNFEIDSGIVCFLKKIIKFPPACVLSFCKSNLEAKCQITMKNIIPSGCTHVL